MPTAEKNAIYLTKGGSKIKLINFAEHAITNKVFVLYSSYRNNDIDENAIKILPLDKFISSSFIKCETG